MENQFLQIQWQDGPLPANGVNGCQVEDVIRAARERLQALQAVLPCVENEGAIGHLDEALARLEARTHRRLDQGVEGTRKPHAPLG